MSENEKKLISRSRSRPSLELYKPPVLRGKNPVTRKVQNLQAELTEENIQKESSHLSPKQG
uniref:Small muscular protein n=1 Tax=Meloidogyne hapla TaxID=6305 RepID=A0A1I8BY48_MELHA